MVQALAAHGVIGDDRIDAELERDPSAAGQRNAATARALRADRRGQGSEAWHLAMHDDDLPNAMQRAVIGGFAHSTQGELLAPYMQRYFDEIGDVWERRTSELAQSVVVGLFPTWHSTIHPDTVAAADAFLAGDARAVGAAAAGRRGTGGRAARAARPRGGHRRALSS